MDKDTYDKIKRNPHYKPNAKQLEEMREFEKKPMVEFGEVPLHNNNVPTHEPLRRKRPSRVVVK